MFITHGPVNPESSLFVGRTDELAKIDEWLKRVICVGVVVGARQTGKTSLLYKACHYYQNKYAFVFINLQDIEGASIAECYSFIAEEITDQLDIQSNKSSEYLPKTGPDFQRFLRQTASQVQVVRVGIILDEIGALPISVAIRLAHSIRSIFTNRIQRSELARYVFILSGATDMLKLTAGRSSPLWNVTESIYLPDLSLSDVETLLREGFRQMGIWTPPGIHEHVFKWTHGHPYWTQLLAANIVREEHYVTEATLDHLVARLLRTEDRNVPHVLGFLEQVDKRLLEIVKAVLSGKIVPFNHIDGTLSTLKTIGLIRDHAGQCAIRNRIYTEALKKFFDEIENDILISVPPVQLSQHQSHEPIQVTLWFSPTKQGAKIVWNSEVSGTVESSFKLPYAPHQLPTILRALEVIQLGDGSSEVFEFDSLSRTILSESKLWDGHRVRKDAYKIIGKRLFDALTRSVKGREALKVVRETARSQGRAVNYILRFPESAIELAALPWEILWDDRQSVLLSRGNRDIDSCERYLDIHEALSPPVPVGQKLKVLMLSPEAGTISTVESDAIFAHLKSRATLNAQGLIEWHKLSPVTMTALDDYMRQSPLPDIIHYHGSGIYKDGMGYLLFDDPDTTHQGEWVSANRLAARFGSIRLLVIQVQQLAKTEATTKMYGGLLTGVAPALSVVSEAVVAMQLTVQTSALTRFTEVFYQELLRGRSLQAAVAEARRSLYVIGGEAASWYVPTLYLRTRDQKPVYLVQPDESVNV